MPAATYKLALLRHAKAEPHAASDELRELAPEGIEQVAPVAAALQRYEVVPEVAYVSSAIRTRQTWTELAKHLDLADCPVTFWDELYTADVAEVLRIVRESDNRHRSILVVGHEPTMSMTARHLAGAGSEPNATHQVRFGLPTAHCALIASHEPWSETSGTWLSHLLGPQS